MRARRTQRNSKRKATQGQHSGRQKIEPNPLVVLPEHPNRWTLEDHISLRALLRNDAFQDVRNDRQKGLSLTDPAAELDHVMLVGSVVPGVLDEPKMKPTIEPVIRLVQLCRKMHENSLQVHKPT